MAEHWKYSFEISRVEDLPIPNLSDAIERPGLIKVYISVLLVIYIQESHVLTSIITATIRHFPRTIRVSLIFTFIYISLALCSAYVNLWKP